MSAGAPGHVPADTSCWLDEHGLVHGPCDDHACRGSCPMAAELLPLNIALDNA